MTDPIASPEGATRQKLTREQVVRGAAELSDQIGATALTIRKLAAHLGVKPMTIYNHVASKDEILDAMVDAIFAEIQRPPTDLAWKEALRVRCHSARDVLARHPWATPLLEARTSPGTENLAHHNAVLECFRNAGFSLALTAHAYALLDSYVYGFAIQEASLPATAGDEMAELVESMRARFEGLPRLQELTTDHVLQPGYDFRNEFEFGLEIVLDGLERAHNAETTQPPQGPDTPVDEKRP